MESKSHQDILQLLPIKAPQIPKDFHIKLRKRFLDTLRTNVNDIGAGSLCLFKGIPTVPKNYDDNDYKVEQESTFWYFFGVQEADCYASIEIDTGKAILFIPKFDEAYKMWMTVYSPEQMKQRHQIDEVKYVQSLEQYLQERQPNKVYVFAGKDSDSGVETLHPTLDYLSKYSIDKSVLFPLISNLRAIKTHDEIEIMRYVCRVSSDAHLRVMRHAKPGILQVQLHGLFTFDHTNTSGSEFLAFNSVCSSGRDCATLHYINNDKIIQSGQLILNDMGGRWYGYCADQAITFPVDGKYTEKQLHVYEAVREAQAEVLKTMKEGVEWTEMHLLAQRVILNHLIKMGIVNAGFDMAELQKKRVGAIFFPHGLGHLLGLKTHDIGGYTEGPERSTEPGLKSLRTRRVLKENMIITVEPGLYFIEHIINNALNNQDLKKYLNKEAIAAYMHVGGVRLEDDVLVTKTGAEVLSHLPRQAKDVEAWLQGRYWKN